jgi:hypothetical protein
VASADTGGSTQRFVISRWNSANAVVCFSGLASPSKIAM